MCGIVGSNFLNKEKLTYLGKLMNHRGPDQEGIYYDNNIGLYHKRLSIIDLSKKAKQPMEYKKYVIIFNGEIYNFKEIKKKLEKKGHLFKTHTDTEVIIHAYEEYGTECLKTFNGDFSIVIYNKNNSTIFLARDVFGFKPLYYYKKGEKFMFGSELKLFLKSGINKKINQKSLNHYLFFGSTPIEESILVDVKKLKPGSYMIYDLKTNDIKEYKHFYRLNFNQNINDFNEIKKNILKKLDKSIKYRMISDVPIGAFLSGGIDSSIITYYMSKYSHNLKTFSAKFDYPEYDESKWAKIISEKFKTKHYEIKFNAIDILKKIKDLPYFFDEPFGDPSMLPTYLVSEVARKEVTVCLSGTGGDELFAGYQRINEFLILKKINKLPNFLKRTISFWYSFLSHNSDKASKLKLLLNTKSDLELYIKLFSYLFRTKNEKFNALDLKNFNKFFKYNDSLSNVLNFEQQFYLPSTLLVKEDRATMGVSLEGRVPFLDINLVAYVNSIKSKLKIKKGMQKYLLKKIFKGIIPKEILYRKKVGFGVPLKYYFRKELKKFAYDKIFNFKGYNYYNKNEIKKLWNQHQSNKSDYSHLFWVIIMFNLWHEKWMK